MLRMATAFTIMLALASPAAAETFTHEASGLAIDLPEGYTTKGVENGSFEFAIGLHSPDGPAMPEGEEFQCLLGYTSGPQNAAMSQEEINKEMATPEFQQKIGATLGQIFAKVSQDTFTYDNLTGTEYVGIPVAGPGAEGVRVYLTLVDTPKGRASLSCATTAEALEEGLAAFRDIRDRVAPPR